MSGLCGFIGYGASATDNRAVIETMAAPLARFHGAPLQSMQGRKSAVGVVASTATRWYGQEGRILRFVFWHSLILAVLMGLLVLVWLPLLWGPNGVVAMLVVVFVFKLAFGAFAMVWMPRWTRALQRFLAAPAADDHALLAALQ